MSQTNKIPEQQLSIIYDGECGFCIRSLKFIRKFDSKKRLALYDFHDAQSLASKFPMVSKEQAEEAMLVVDPGKRVFPGFFAFRRIILELPVLYPLLLLFYFPGASLVGPWIYSRVAKNRHRFGCQSDVCRP